MNLHLTVQIASKSEHLPTQEQMNHWIQSALKNRAELSLQEPEITVRIVDLEEGAELNQQWRQKQGPTNVLSFPYTDDDFAGELLGDLVVCAPVVEREAQEQKKSLESHWAHMLIHGSLHLLGFDHITDDEAEAMEALETGILQNLGYANPYDP